MPRQGRSRAKARARSTPATPTKADLPRLKRYFTETEQLTQPALPYAHSVHADTVARGVESGISHAQTQQAKADQQDNNDQQ